MRILVVEDDELLLEFLKRSLKIDRHVLDTAKNGIDALAKVDNHEYDVIIMDIIMPLKNGVETCKELRANGNNTPIIFLTSRDSEASRVLGLDAGADDYLTKPFSYSELSARLRALSRRHTGTLQPVVTIGNLTLDESKHRITKDGELMRLRPKEYTLLEYLMRNNEHALTREEVLEKVWGVLLLSTSNRLDVCIKQVRKKLGNNPLTPKIISLHGYGYRLEIL